MWLHPVFRMFCIWDFPVPATLYCAQRGQKRYCQQPIHACQCTVSNSNSHHALSDLALHNQQSCYYYYDSFRVSLIHEMNVTCFFKKQIFPWGSKKVELFFVVEIMPKIRQRIYKSIARSLILYQPLPFCSHLTTWPILFAVSVTSVSTLTLSQNNPPPFLYFFHWILFIQKHCLKCNENL